MKSKNELKSFGKKLISLPVIQRIFSALEQDENDIVLLVGGVVRDYISSGIISKDLDISTNLSVEVVLQRLRQKGIQNCMTHAIRYGCISIVLDGFEIAITTFRKDIETFGRSARIEKSDNIYEDASRRDFTMNAIYVDKNGNVIDFFNGIEDILQKRVRFINSPKERIIEDFLRIIRFFRFSGKLKCDIDDTIVEVIKEHAYGLKMLSKERITKEIALILEQTDDARILQIMSTSGIFETIFGTGFTINYEKLISHLENLRQNSNAEYLKKTISEVKKVVKNLSFANRDIKGEILSRFVDNIFNCVKNTRSLNLLSFILSITSERHQRAIINSLSITSKEKTLMEFAMRFGQVFEKSISDQNVIDCCVEHRRNNIEKIISMAIVNKTNFTEILTLLAKLEHFPISGRDVVNAVGVLEGETIGLVLKTIEKVWIRNNFTNSEEEMLKSVEEIAKRLIEFSKSEEFYS